MRDFMLLTVSVAHNLNIINDISTRRLGYCYFTDVVSVSRSLGPFQENHNEFRIVFV